MRNSKKHISYFAFLAHRLSGLALALFLPFHFFVLALALQNPKDLDGFLAWADQPLVKFAEWGLIALLTSHLVFGLRLLVLENLKWRGQKPALVWAGVVIAIVASGVFLVRSF